MKLIVPLAVLLVSISGCSSKPEAPTPVVQSKYEIVEVPGVAVPCRIPAIEKPVDLVASLKKSDTLYHKVKVILADVELRKGYATKLETATASCNQSK